MTPIRVRFAPSPTGHLHVGGARTALFNWLFARHAEGVFVLRIEDTDAQRSTPESTRGIFEGLKWLGLTWDEGPDVGGPFGPYVQTERKAIYHEACKSLLHRDLAYPCYCTPDELKARRDEALAGGRSTGYDGRCRMLPAAERQARKAAGLPEAIRIRTPPGESAWTDLIKGEIRFEHQNLEDFVILKSDGNPTYNFAAAVDDIRMEISHVIRGDDHVSNTPRQIILYRLMEAPLPEFAHVPMILGGDGSRLSKRHGATAIDAYAELGFLPSAMINYLALLGWSLDGEREVFSREDLIRHFSLERCGSTPSVFDLQKLEWMNGLYLRELPLEDRTRLVASFLERQGRWPFAGRDEAWLARAVQAVGDRMRRVPQFLDVVGFLFQSELTLEPALVEDLRKKDRTAEILGRLADMIRSLSPFDEATAEAELRQLAGSMGLKAGELIHPLRLTLTGSKTGPGIFETLVLLGREEAVRRILGVRRTLSGQAS